MKKKIIIVFIFILLIFAALFYFVTNADTVLYYLFKPEQIFIENFVKEIKDTENKLESKEQQQLKEGDKIRGVVVDWRRNQNDGIIYHGSIPIIVKESEHGDDALVKITGFSKTGKSAYAVLERKYANYMNEGSITELIENKNYKVIVSGPNAGGDYFALYFDGKLIIHEADRTGEKMVVRYIGQGSTSATIKTKQHLAVIVQRNILN